MAQENHDGQGHRIGVYVCQCGTNIAKMVDCDGVAGDVAEMPGVTVSRSYKYMCSNPGQEMIAKDIKEHGLDRVVVAACSPHMHELTFRKAVQQADMNPYFLEIANIREQCSWVHDDRVEATLKAKDLVTAAVERVVWQEALERMSVDMCPNCLIIGGGIAGMTAALDLAEAGGRVYLVERTDHLGGQVAHIDLTAPYLDSARDIINERVTRVMEHPQIDVLFEAQVREVNGYVGNFQAVISTPKAADAERVYRRRRQRDRRHRLQDLRRCADRPLRLWHAAQRGHVPRTGEDAARGTRGDQGG